MKSLQLFALLSICVSSHTFAQSGLFWSQYASGNPAATGVNSDLDVSSITTYYGHSNVSERLNADIRIKKLHGAIGVGYRYFANNGVVDFRTNNPYLNYSFHWKTGENSLLAFGASVDFTNGRTTFPQGYYGDTYTIHRQQTLYGLGTHFQYKRLKIGAAVSTYQDFSQSGVEISDLYIDYTFKFGENWQLHTAAHTGSDRYQNIGKGIMARAVYKNKYWLGASFGGNNEIGFMAGINLNDRWSIGYSMGTHLSGGQGNYIMNQNLVVRFQMPWR